MKTESSSGVSGISFTAKLALTLAAVIAAAGPTLGQVLEPPPASLQLPAPAHRGTVERIKVHGQSLEGNLEGDSPDRDVSIYLPPSYKAHPKQHYPVLYLLHGYFDRDDNWFGARHVFVDAPLAIDRAIASGAREMIAVMPDAHTAYMGSMYSNSVTTGDWEAFITHDLVSYIDSHYRTIPGRPSRGLAGHSMGGYGTIRMGMKYPEAFASLYAMSACCLAPNPNAQWPGMEKVEAIRTTADVAKVDFGTGAIIAMAAAWSPDPKKPPLYLDLPVADGKVQPAVVARWDANAPLAMLDQYVNNLKKIDAVEIDVGTKDGLMPSIQELDARLTLYGIEHTFETYDGTHVSGIQTRLENNVIPYFSKHLSFGRTKP
jgi:enterochelin esterase-like enzyme